MADTSILNKEGIVNYDLTFLPIDRTDTIGTLIDKINENFCKLSCLFEPGDIEDDDHEENLLCDAIFVKPHQPVHRRRKIAGAGNDEDLKNTDWLDKVDWLYGDIALVEQKRSDKIGNDVYMFTISGDKNDGPELINKTKISGPPGEDGAISPESMETILKSGIKKLLVNSIDTQEMYLLDYNGDQSIEISGNKGSIIVNTISTDNISDKSGNGINVSSPLIFTNLDGYKYDINNKHNYEYGRVFLGLKNIDCLEGANKVYSCVPCDGNYYITSDGLNEKTNEYEYSLYNKNNALTPLSTSSIYSKIYNALDGIPNGLKEIPKIELEVPANCIYYMTLY